MSASPSHPTSVKRPLEEASSPSRATDQPEAKRPALDKVVKNDQEIEPMVDRPVEGASSDQPAFDQGNAVKPEKPVDSQGGESTSVEEKATPAVPGQTSGPPAGSNDETAWIHVRAVISSPEAATIIGKGGENVSNIRKMSGAKCTVSDYQKGAVERILTVSGVVDAVAKAFGLIIRTLNNEALNEPSTAQSKTYPLRLLIPHILIGSIIGKGGQRIREIQDASGARLNASDSCLPMSSERSLVVMGVADAVHIATYYVASTLLEQLKERFGGPAASAYATRSGGPAGAVPGGMQVIPYNPQPSSGQYGRGDHYSRRHDARTHQMAPGPYPQQYHPPPAHAMPMQQYAGQPAAAYGAAPQMPPHTGAPHAGGPAGPHGQPMAAGPGGTLTQQIYIPNDMVGAIIGKGGSKINEIRQLSGSVIKINEPQDNSNERLVTITGTEECNRMALYLLYQRLGETKQHQTVDRRPF